MRIINIPGTFVRLMIFLLIVQIFTIIFGCARAEKKPSGSISQKNRDQDKRIPEDYYTLPPTPINLDIMVSRRTRVANEAVSIPGIRQAYVLADAGIVIVGVNLDEGFLTADTNSITREVENRIESVEAANTIVRVTANDQIVEKIKTIDQRFRQGGSYEEYQTAVQELNHLLSQKTRRLNK